MSAIYSPRRPTKIEAEPKFWLMLTLTPRLTLKTNHASTSVAEDSEIGATVGVEIVGGAGYFSKLTMWPVETTYEMNTKNRRETRRMVGSWVGFQFFLILLLCDILPHGVEGVGECWQASKPFSKGCDAKLYTSRGYTCVGSFCSVDDPSKSQKACAVKQLENTVVDISTGKCGCAAGKFLDVVSNVAERFRSVRAADLGCGR